MSAAYGTLTYTYNEIGNMTSNLQKGNYTYVHDSLNLHLRPHAVKWAGSIEYGYDDNGNMTSGDGRTITYDYDNRPASIAKGIKTVNFIYDYTGQRTKKSTVDGSTTIYADKLYECKDGVCTKYVFAGSTRIASISSTGVRSYYHGDHLGSSSIVTNSTGTAVEEEIYYYPFGGTRSNTGSVNVPYKFTDQEEDAETGLYYYGARYYDPQLGRFISPDTIVQDPSDPQAFNRYTYTRNNPLIYTDPTGNSWDSFSLTFNNDYYNNWGGSCYWCYNQPTQFTWQQRESYWSYLGSMSSSSSSSYTSVASYASTQGQTYNSAYGSADRLGSNSVFGNYLLDAYYNQLSGIADAIDRDATYYWNTRDWNRTFNNVETGLSATSAVLGIASAVPVFAPVTAPLAAGARGGALAARGLRTVATMSTITSVLIKLNQKISGEETSWYRTGAKIALEVAPGAGKLGASGLKHFGKMSDVGLEGAHRVFDIAEHQIGVLGVTGMPDKLIDATIR